jgi:CheY-like chemotaxis protein
MAHVVALIDDLFFQAKVAETARQIGVDVRICAAPEPLLAEIGKESPKLAVLDLNAQSDALGVVKQLRAKAIPVIGFLSHVQTELIERAKAAGCTEVMPRSIFTRNLATILSRAKAETI